jgi:hypothetical protein
VSKIIPLFPNHFLLIKKIKMKKLFLLLSAGLVGLVANAQQSQSIMISHPLSAAQEKSRAIARPLAHSQSTARHNNQSAAAKTTNANGAWFDYYYQLDNGSGTYNGYELYQDSNIVYAGTTQSSFFHGLGESFDPTDSSFYYTMQNSAAGFVNFQIMNSNSYEVDSFEFNGKYQMNNPNYVDTLILELMVAGSSNSGTYLVQYTEAGAISDWYNINPQGMPRFADAAYASTNMATPPIIYNEMDNSVITSIQRDTMILNAAVFADTNSDGSEVFQFNLSAPLQVPAGSKVIAFVHFKSGFEYPLGTSDAVANYIIAGAGVPTAPGIPPPQSVGSYQAGLIADNQNTYSDTGFVLTGISNYDELIPNSAYDGAPGWDAPDFNFYVTCSSCYNTSVKSVNSIVSKVSAYPSPANDNVNVSFTLGNSADVTVSLTNEIGQVVNTQNFGNVASGIATLNTSTLPAGVYFYTVNANGERSTGKVLVAH